MFGLFQNNLFKISNNALDALFPPACVSCRASGFWLCEKCFESIDFDVTAPSIMGVDQMYALGSYANPVLRALLTSYKYDSASCLEPILKGLLEKWGESSNLHFEGAWTIVATPTDARHILERGFDHTKFLARIVRDLLLPNATIVGALERIRKTEANANLPEQEMRKGNILGAIQLTESVKGNILLVDDVVTSGATMGECARILRATNIKRVEGFAFALGG